MDLKNFLKQRDILYTLCAASISSQIVLIADVLTSSFIVPVMNKNAQQRIENFSIDMKGIKIELGKLIIAIIRLMIVLLTLFILFKFLH